MCYSCLKPHTRRSWGFPSHFSQNFLPPPMCLLGTDGGMLAYLLFLCPQSECSINVGSRLLSSFIIIEKILFLKSTNRDLCKTLKRCKTSSFREGSLPFWKGTAWENQCAPTNGLQERSFSWCYKLLHLRGCSPHPPMPLIIWLYYELFGARNYFFI